MTKTRKLAPIAIGLACTAALLGAVIYEDLSLGSRAAMALRSQIESAADAIAAKLGQGLNVRFTFARALGAHIVSQNAAQDATPAMDTGRFADLMTRNHGVVEALLAFPAEPDPARAADGAKIPEVLLRGLEAGAGRAAFERARASSKPVVETSAGFADGLDRILGFFPIVDDRAAGGGAPTYLGMAVMVMPLDGILAEAGAVTGERLKIAIRETRADGTSRYLGARYLGARAAETFASDPVTKAVRFPMGSWELAAVPRYGWRQASPVLTSFRILGVLMAGLVGLLAYFLARRPAKIRLVVDSANRELRAQKDELAIAQSRLANAIGNIPKGGAVVPLPDPGPAQSGVRILIAEDNLANQMVIKHFLDMGGYRADVASNGLEAVHAAQARAYDLVLMDISMPEMDGITAAAEIRDLARDRDTAPIMVAVTAHALPRDRERFLAAGFDEVLVKPLRKDELFRALSKWLSVAPADPDARRSLD